MKNGQAAGASRLTDITVEEVSLVDRAANNHRFLLVKRSDAMLNGDEALESQELEPEEEEDEDEAAESTGAAPAAPSTPVDLEPILTELKTLASRLDALSHPAPAPAPPLPANPTTTSDSEAAEGTLAAVTALTKAVEKLTDSVKAQGQRLATLEKSTTERASVAEARGEAEPFGWPLDMNRPCDRRSTHKSVSFHDAHGETR